ncbi:MAG: GNAT family N-acetyltransferase [Oscillatoriales cyanobacterium RM2_1_1]|nr:GNAT family N-acetyltransferase [Oscillatoriales cyanobacterium SM2_3_0]NJO44805.1 GNAT family N-acetyltransferase [Oscillatoriales cyanobacterium RM2_1_1]
MRLGIHEDLRQRFVAESKCYVCLAAVFQHSAGSSGIGSASNPETLVGTVELGLRSRYPWQTSSAHKYLYISNLAVHPQFRNRGIAQELLRQCEQIALNWNFPSIYLHVLEDNAIARRLYRRMGYQIRAIDWNWNSALLGQPRQLLLHKPVTSSQRSP